MPPATPKSQCAFTGLEQGQAESMVILMPAQQEPSTESNAGCSHVLLCCGSVTGQQQPSPAVQFLMHNARTCKDTVCRVPIMCSCECLVMELDVPPPCYTCGAPLPVTHTVYAFPATLEQMSTGGASCDMYIDCVMPLIFSQCNCNGSSTPPAARALSAGRQVRPLQEF